MTELTYRQQMLGHCMRLAAELDPAYAQNAAAWYEANQPEELNGLAERVRRDIDKLSASSSQARSLAKGAHASGAQPADTRASTRQPKP